jgi:hypothetical protein
MLYCRKQPVCIRESLHLDRPRWHRVLAIPLLLSAASGIRHCGWKITRLEVFTKVGGPLYPGEVGNTCSFMMPEIKDRWPFLFFPLTCRMTCTRYLFHKDCCSIQCQRRQWTDAYSPTFTAPVSRLSLLTLKGRNLGLCLIPLPPMSLPVYPPWPNQHILKTWGKPTQPLTMLFCSAFYYVFLLRSKCPPHYYISKLPWYLLIPVIKVSNVLKNDRKRR